MRKISEKRLSKLGGRVPSSTITGTRKKLRAVNPERRAKRRAGYRKMLAGKEYKAAKAEAMERSGNQCEFTGPPFVGGWDGPHKRCFWMVDLHAHHLRYPKSRPVEARDLLIVCEPHHEYLESQKMHKTRMF